MSLVLGTIMFGTPSKGGLGACAGQGYCEVYPVQPGSPTQVVPGQPTSGPVLTDDAHISHHKGTTVAFQLSPIDKSVLVMSFRLSDLEKNQPEQVAFFKSGEYTFESDYHFKEQHLFSDLAFHHSPRIEKGKKNSVHISGDLVTTFFHYRHD